VGGACSANGENNDVYSLLVGKPQRERERSLSRPIRKWVDNIKIDFVEMGWGGVDWIGLAQNRNKWRELL
jgi:hypothetical protein